jgi:lipid II:glycine glycyltransferase (peptidoglycan interpeptide bridge formation enzyme)
MDSTTGIWQGTFEIWQNRNFGKTYAEFSNFKLYFINGIQLYVSSRALMGNTTLYLYGASSEEKWITQLIALARELKLAKIWIYSIEYLYGIKKYYKEEIATLVMNLTMDEKQLWKQIGDKTRNMIRKGEREDVIIKEAENDNEFEQWWTIYTKTAQVKGFVRQNYSLVKELYKKKDIAKLFVAAQKNIIIAGSFFLIDKYPLYWLGAFDRKYKKCVPGYLTMWKAILYFKGKGYVLLDFGGASFKKEDGTTRFKASFNGEVRKGYIYEIPINKYKLATLNVLARLMSIKEKKG